MVLARESSEQAGDGSQLTIELTARETESLGHDAQLMAEILDSALWALGMLRTGVNSRDPGAPSPAPGDWHACLRGLERLSPRIDGIRRGATRAYLSAGGSPERLATALHVDQPTARHIAAQLPAETPDPWQSWATSHPSPPQGTAQ